MIRIWKFISILILPFFLPLFFLYTLLTRIKRRGLNHHLGWVPRLNSDSRFKKTLWLFAVSVGEVGSAVPVLRTLHQHRPDLRIVVSVTTEAGYDVACKQLNFIQALFFNPLDIWPIPWIATRRIRPDIFIVTETGFWPGQLHSMEKLGIPALLFQGRISDKTMQRYRTFASWSYNLLNQFQYIGMQNIDGVNKVKELGVDSEKIDILGNTKFDRLIPLDEEGRVQVLQRFNLAEGAPVFVAGSTHEGEEEIILDAFKILKENFSTLTLILAPRRLERLDEIERLLKSREVTWMKRADIIPGRVRRGSIILLDTMGELSSLYSVAHVAFVGKSLLPPGGGHSLLEPVAQGIPVLHGPFIEYQQATLESLNKEGIASEVKGVDDLNTAVRAILSNSDLREKVAWQGPKWIATQRGASKKMAEIILNRLNEVD